MNQVPRLPSARAQPALMKSQRTATGRSNRSAAASRPTSVPAATAASAAAPASASRPPPPSGLRQAPGQPFDQQKQMFSYLVNQDRAQAQKERNPETTEARLMKVKQKARSRATANLHRDFAKLIDIDGDGHIDSEEFKMFNKLEQMEFDGAADLNNDGIIDEMEMQVAREVEGRRLMAKAFVDRQYATNPNGNMFRYAPRYNGMSKAQVIDTIAGEKYFAPLMQSHKRKEQMFKLSASDGVMGCLTVPRTGRPLTGRDDDISLRRTGHVSYHADRRVAPSCRVDKAAALNSSCNYKSGGFGRRSREDVLFSARKHRVTEYNRHKGDIPVYGTFANYRHIQLLNHHG